MPSTLLRWKSASVPQMPAFAATWNTTSLPGDGLARGPEVGEVAAQHPDTPVGERRVVAAGEAR